LSDAYAYALIGLKKKLIPELFTLFAKLNTYFDELLKISRLQRTYDGEAEPRPDREAQEKAWIRATGLDLTGTAVQETEEEKAARQAEAKAKKDKKKAAENALFIVLLTNARNESKSASFRAGIEAAAAIMGLALPEEEMPKAPTSKPASPPAKGKGKPKG